MTSAGAYSASSSWCCAAISITAPRACPSLSAELALTPWKAVSRATTAGRYSWMIADSSPARVSRRAGIGSDSASRITPHST
nr:hypothetical protein [Nannocystis sp.]